MDSAKRDSFTAVKGRRSWTSLRFQVNFSGWYAILPKQDSVSEEAPDLWTVYGIVLYANQPGRTASILEAPAVLLLLVQGVRSAPDASPDADGHCSFGRTSGLGAELPLATFPFLPESFAITTAVFSIHRKPLFQ